MEQPIHFCTTPRGARIAFGVVGTGPALVIPPGWISAIETMWDDPPYRSFMEALAQRHTVVTYDKYGCGLSDRDRTEFTLESELEGLDAVIEHLKLKRFALFGMSQGGPTAIAYAVRSPRRVSHLVLYATYARGATVSTPDFMRAFIDLVRVDWGVGSKAMADFFVPGADAETRSTRARTQRRACSAEMAAHLLELTYDVDVSGLLPKLRVPTLVLHRKGDRAVPFRAGRELASMLPSARFLPLEGNIHPPGLGDSAAVLAAVAEFLGDRPPAQPAPVETVHTGASAPAADAARTGHAIFLSYAAEDRAAAAAILAALEAAGVPCWMAPRDIPPGSDYAAAIVEAVRCSRALLLVFSEHANRSPHVRREVERATSLDVPLLPVRIEAVTPGQAMEYFLSTSQWFDAHDGPLEQHLPALTTRVQELLGQAAARV
jgi:pimeloyl-ACP methyl ester carboxylesterase